jgi:hypothetical protein
MTTQIQKELIPDASIVTTKFDLSAKAPFAGIAETRPKNIALLACIKY